MYVYNTYIIYLILTVTVKDEKFDSILRNM